VRRSRHATAGVLCLAVLCAASTRAAAPARPQSAPRAAATATHTRLQPHFLPGEVLRYRTEFQTTSNAKPTGGIEDPEGPTQVAITWDALIRLDVLPAPREAPGAPAPRASSPHPPAPGAVRLRTTYEESVASVRSDTPNPQADRIKSQYAKLQGRSIEFTLDGDGNLSHVRGLDGILPGQSAAQAARQWMAQFAGASLPAAGVVPGQHWSSLEPADSLPLAGLVWRTDSTYLRNEPCRPGNPSGAASRSEPCAVILSRLLLLAPHSRRDPTPEAYRRNGLRTSGTWQGSGESLTYIALHTGWVVSVTQTATERMDVTIFHGAEVALRSAGTVVTHSSVLLLPGAAAASP
jgi:hypothetical protein